jgi:uncharacterized membrane protein YfcA
MGRWAWLGIAAIVVVMAGAVLRIEPLNRAFFAYTIIVPIALGAFMLFFNRRFVLDSLRFQERVFKIRFGEQWVPFYRVFAGVIGAIFLVVGIVQAVELVLP